MKTPCGVTPPPPHFGAWRFRAPFRQVALAGKCLPILWLILFDLGGSLADLVRSCHAAYACHLRTNICKHRYKSINNSIKIAKDRPNIYQKSTKSPSKFNQNRFGKRVGSRPPPKWHRLMFFSGFLAPLGRCRAPFWAELDPEGRPQIVFLGIMLEK